MNVYVDAHQLSDFGRQLRKAAPEVARQFNRDLRQATEGAKVEAQITSSWSRQIPGSIRVMGGASNLRIVAGPEPVIAELYSRPKGFRHPVFGNREVWVAQKGRPFLWPAWLARREEVWRRIGAGIDKAMRAAGFS